jgi:flagellar basal-body rod protein FlgC
MDISFSTSISGIQTALKRHDVTAHNVANVNTPGFAAANVTQTDVRPGGVRIASIDRSTNTDATLSNTDLAKEAGEQIENKNTLAADVKVLKVKDRMLGELLDLFA